MQNAGLSGILSGGRTNARRSPGQIARVAQRRKGGGQIAIFNPSKRTVRQHLFKLKHELNQPNFKDCAEHIPPSFVYPGSACGSTRRK